MAYSFERSNVVICAIPPKLGQNNRFANIVNRICQNLKIENGLNYLYCNKDYGNNKIRGARDREISLDGVFQYLKILILTVAILLLSMMFLLLELH